jgi:hypothetical protein
VCTFYYTVCEDNHTVIRQNILINMKYTTMPCKVIAKTISAVQNLRNMYNCWSKAVTQYKIGLMRLNFSSITDIQSLKNYVWSGYKAFHYMFVCCMLFVCVCVLFFFCCSCCCCFCKFVMFSGVMRCYLTIMFWQ